MIVGKLTPPYRMRRGMIKGRGETDDGTQVLLLGLSAENIKRLHQDKPILVTAADMVGMGFPALEVVIIAGETEASMAQALGGLPLQPDVAGQVFTQRPRRVRD